MGADMVKRWIVVALVVAAAAAQARLVEEIVSLPVEVRDMYGRAHQHAIVVTIFREDTMPKPYPVAIIGHGRAGTAQERVDLKRARYSATSRWLTQLGFIVAVPTRIGYGETGGPDIENSGDCNKRNYPPGYLAAADQTEAVIAMLRTRPDVARDRGVVIGQSYGGATAIAIASRNSNGIQATVNFAGGGGGDPVNQPQRPCSPVQLKRMFADFGKTARLPTLWIYSENDMYFGPVLSREWFDAFRAAGGQGEFFLLPANGADGHKAFSDFPDLWRGKLQEFLQAQGFAPPAMPKGRR